MTPTQVFKQDFRSRLLDHLLARINGRPYDGDEHSYSTSERDSILIDQNRMYEHKTIRFKSTTYDARRTEESANPRTTHADIIVLSHEDGAEGRLAFPYWHARIIGIYHFMVRKRIEGATGLSTPSRMDVLFVRWFGLDSPDGQSGWGARQLHKVGFLPDTNEHGPAFGFLDPNEVLRMVHLIPDFASFRTKDLLRGPSMAIQDPHSEGEYPVYYVAMYVRSISASGVSIPFLGFQTETCFCGTAEGESDIWQPGSAMRHCLLTSTHPSRERYRTMMKPQLSRPVAKVPKIVKTRVKRMTTTNLLLALRLTM